MICPNCHREFHCPRGHKTAHPCLSCDYTDQMEAADKRFRPLIKALEAEGFKGLVVDQTGGMVMCLRVPGPGQSWVWFSDWGWEDRAFFGAYRWVEDEGATFATDIRFKPKNAKRIARWAAPLIRAFFAKQDEELDADTVESIGLDPTGRDGDPRFPYTWAKLTEGEWRRLGVPWLQAPLQP